MRFDVISLFPEVIEAYCRVSILGRALKNSVIQVHQHDLRDFGVGPYKKVDDIPYGGGGGQILSPEPLFKAHAAIPKSSQTQTIVLTPRGKQLNQPLIREFSRSYSQLIIICGRYEGIDERVMSLANHEISLGNYILTGGELGAMILIDAVTRLQEGTFSKGASVPDQDSFADPAGTLLEAPQYTRPEIYDGMKVPEVLLSGDHKKIKAWRESFQNP